MTHLQDTVFCYNEYLGGWVFEKTIMDSGFSWMRK